MLFTKAIFHRKEVSFETTPCVVERVITLPDDEYRDFTRNMLTGRDFIRDNRDCMSVDPDGTTHCLLVVSDAGGDGVLINSSGYDYARYASFMPRAADWLRAQNLSPALAALNKKLADVVDFIGQNARQSAPGSPTVLRMDELEQRFDIQLEGNGMLVGAVLGMLCDQPGIEDIELDGNMLILYKNAPELEHAPEMNM